MPNGLNTIYWRPNDLYHSYYTTYIFPNEVLMKELLQSVFIVMSHPEITHVPREYWLHPVSGICALDLNLHSKSCTSIQRVWHHLQNGGYLDICTLWLSPYTNCLASLHLHIIPITIYSLFFLFTSTHCILSKSTHNILFSSKHHGL